MRNFGIDLDPFGVLRDVAKATANKLTKKIEKQADDAAHLAIGATMVGLLIVPVVITCTLEHFIKRPSY